MFSFHRPCSIKSSLIFLRKGMWKTCISWRTLYDRRFLERWFWFQKPAEIREKCYQRIGRSQPRWNSRCCSRHQHSPHCRDPLEWILWQWRFPERSFRRKDNLFIFASVLSQITSLPACYLILHTISWFASGISVTRDWRTRGLEKRPIYVITESWGLIIFVMFCLGFTGDIPTAASIIKYRNPVYDLLGEISQRVYTAGYLSGWIWKRVFSKWPCRCAKSYVHLEWWYTNCAWC